MEYIKFFLIIVMLSLILYLFIKNKYFLNIKKINPKLLIKNYEIIYTDEKGDFDPKKILVSKIIYSKKYDLRGKPDYIFKHKNKLELIPVELKSGTIGEKNTPWHNDLMQLTAYFLIIEDVFYIRPKEGRIIYKDYMFVIKNTNKLNKELLNISNNMRSMLETGKGKPNNSFSKCKNCICNRTVCEYSKK